MMVQLRDMPIKVKAGPADGLGEGEFIAYASTFTRTPDSYGDVVAQGAFAQTLKEWAESGNSMPVLYGHRLDDPDYNIGTVVSAAEDEHGLLVTGQLDLDNPKATQVYRLLKGRRLSQMSFAFDTLEEGGIELDDGEKANELRRVKLYEVSVVPVGANQETEILAVKTATALAETVKAGRVLSAKNIASLQSAQEAIGSVLADADRSDGGDEGKASPAASPTADAPPGAPATEAERARSVRARALLLITEAL